MNLTDFATAGKDLIAYECKDWQSGSSTRLGDAFFFRKQLATLPHDGASKSSHV
jgi:hypothetical protein